MLRIAVCDDMEAYGKMLSKMIQEWALKRQLNIHLERFLSGEELLAAMELSGYYDIVLLDIDLKDGINGVETAIQIKQKYMHFCLIFISQYNTYYRDAFQVHPFQYLEKPISAERLIENLNQAVDNYRYLNEIYTFRFKGMTYSLMLAEVLYFVSDRRVVRVYTEKGKEYMFYEKLDEVEYQLNEYNCQFLRIHKSYLVNCRQIERYHPKQIRMRNGDVLPVSVDKRNKVIEFHMNLLDTMG